MPDEAEFDASADNDRSILITGDNFTHWDGLGLLTYV